jgi:CBS domain-containing protein
MPNNDGADLALTPKRRSIMKVQEIMTKDPDCCLPSDSAQKAAKIMKQADVGVVPVVATGLDQKVVGIVTDRDLCLSVVAEGSDPASVTLEKCMTGKIVSCQPNDDIQRAAQLMEENQIRRIPVVNEDNEIIGIVSLADIAQSAASRAGETLKEVSEPSAEASKPRSQQESKD